MRATDSDADVSPCATVLARRVSCAPGALRVRDRPASGISDRPVISAGCAMPIMCSSVGATSARRPFVDELLPLEAVVDDDQLDVVGRVGGVRAAGGGVDHLLAVAVVGGDDRDAALPLRRRRGSGRRRCRRARRPSPPPSSTPVWPTMSPLAKLTTIRSYSAAVDPLRPPRRRSPYALISGIWS